MTEEQRQDYQTKLWDTLDVSCGGYNSSVDVDILAILKLITEDRTWYVTDIAKSLESSESHVELIQYLLCSADLCEYGTSPRGCWATDKGKEFWTHMKPYYEYCYSK